MLIIMAALLPLSMSDPSLPCYATIQEAATEALRQAVVVGGEYEAGGAIYRHGPLYCFTQPVTQKLAHAVDYRVGLVAPDKLVGLFHTHPANTGSEYLSTSDIQLSKRMHMPLFVLVVRAAYVLVSNACGYPLDPSSVVLETVSLGSVQYIVRGRFEGYILLERNGKLYRSNTP